MMMMKMMYKIFVWDNVLMTNNPKLTHCPDFLVYSVLFSNIQR